MTVWGVYIPASLTLGEQMVYIRLVMPRHLLIVALLSPFILAGLLARVIAAGVKAGWAVGEDVLDWS